MVLVPLVTFEPDAGLAVRYTVVDVPDKVSGLMMGWVTYDSMVELGSLFATGFQLFW